MGTTGLRIVDIGLEIDAVTVHGGKGTVYKTYGVRMGCILRLSNDTKGNIAHGKMFPIIEYYSES